VTAKINEFLSFRRNTVSRCNVNRQFQSYVSCRKSKESATMLTTTLSDLPMKTWNHWLWNSNFYICWSTTLSLCMMDRSISVPLQTQNLPFSSILPHCSLPQFFRAYLTYFIDHITQDLISSSDFWFCLSLFVFFVWFFW